MSATASTAVSRRPTSGTLAEVIDIILDKGLVIDAYVRVSLVGIELLTIDIRVVVASVDTYLHFAEAVNRLDIRAQSEEYDADLQDLIGGMAGAKTEGAIDAAGDKAQDTLASGKDRIKALFGADDSEEEEEAEQEES